MNSLVIQLRQQRARAWEQAKTILDAAQKANRRLTPEEGRKFDSLDTEIETLGKDIERAERGESRDRELSAPLRVIPRPLVEGQAVAHNPEVWRTADESEVRVLAPADSMQQYMREKRGESDYQGVGFGEICRAMVLGPRSNLERRALSEGTDSAGGFTVADILLAQLIDRLRAQAFIFKAGARTVPLESDLTNIARVSSDPVPAWRNEGAAVASSDAVFERVQFVARSLAVETPVSRELIEDSVNINQALSKVFAAALAGELDRVALVGSGTAPEPRGIRNSTDVNEKSLGVNGAQLGSGYDDLLDVIDEILRDNANLPTAAMMHPRTFTTLEKKKDGQGNPLARPRVIETLPFYPTTRIPITETQGSASNASHITVGDFTQLLVGIRTSFRVELVKERASANLQYIFQAFLRADIQLAHPQSFGRIVGILP